MMLQHELDGNIDLGSTAFRGEAPAVVLHVRGPNDRRGLGASTHALDLHSVASLALEPVDTTRLHLAPGAHILETGGMRYAAEPPPHHVCAIGDDTPFDDTPRHFSSVDCTH